MSPGAALSLTLWRGAKVGQTGAVFIGLCVAAPLWMLLFKGAYDEPSWVLGSLLIPFAPFLQSALAGGQLGPSLRRADTQSWARRRLLPWLLALVLPWWLALVVPAALLNQTTYGATVWLWFSAVLAASIAVGLSLAWTRWVVLGLSGMVMLASFSYDYWRPSDLEAWLQFLNAPSMMLPLSGILFAGAAGVMYKVRQALTGVIPSINAHTPIDWTAAFSRATEAAAPRPGHLGGLLNASATRLDRWLMVAGPLALFICSAMISSWLLPHLDQPIFPLLIALIPGNLFNLNPIPGQAMPPPRGLLLPRGLHRPSLLRETLWLYGTCSTTWGSAITKASLTLGLAWGMHWTLTETLSLFAAIAASLLAELSLAADRQRRSIRGTLRHVAVLGLMGLIVGCLKGGAELLQLKLAAVILLASALISLLAVIVIAAQAPRWRRLTL